MIYETRDQIYLAVRDHKITVHAALLLIRQLDKINKIKEEVRGNYKNGYHTVA